MTLDEILGTTPTSEIEPIGITEEDFTYWNQRIISKFKTETKISFENRIWKRNQKSNSILKIEIENWNLIWKFDLCTKIKT